MDSEKTTSFGGGALPDVVKWWMGTKREGGGVAVGSPGSPCVVGLNVCEPLVYMKYPN